MLLAESITFTPDAGFKGYASFDYRISDGVNETVARVTVAVGDPNAIVAEPDSITTYSPGSVIKFWSSSLLANDKAANGNTPYLNALGDATHGTVSFSDYNGGDIQFIPEEGFFGDAGLSITSPVLQMPIWSLCMSLCMSFRPRVSAEH